MSPRFYLQTLPLASLGFVGTAVGLRLAAVAEGAAMLAIALAVGLASFVAARTFRGYAGWMALFIMGLSLAAGVVLDRLGWNDGPAPAAVAVGILLLMAIIGRAVPRWFSLLFTPLWLFAWLSVIGWIGLWLAGGAGAWTVPLSLIITLVFAGLSAAWFARLPPDPQPVAAMDLYLLALNLFLTIGFLKGGSVQP